MVLCADGHRRGWNLNGTIRSNQSEKKTDSFISLSFIMFFFLHECWEKKSVFYKSNLTVNNKHLLWIKTSRTVPSFGDRATTGHWDMQPVQQHSAMWDCTLLSSFNVFSKVTNSAFQFSPSQTFCLRQTNRQSVFNKGTFDYQSQSPLLQAKLVHLRKIQFLGIYD